MIIENIKKTKRAEVSDNALITISGEHLMTHQGKAFVYSRTDNLGSGAQVNIGMRLDNPEKCVHIVPILGGLYEINAYLFENSVYTGGTVFSGVNRKRIPPIGTHEGVWVLNPTITDVGNPVFLRNLGAGKTTGGETRGQMEWILAPEVNYILRLESLQNGNKVDMLLEWYEELIELL